MYQEFAYLLERMRAVPEGDGTLLDNIIAISSHEHAEANPHKCRGMAILLAGGGGKMKTGMHTKTSNTIGDIYKTITEEIFKVDVNFPTAEEKISEVV